MISEHTRMMRPASATPMTEEEFDDAKDAIRALNLPDVKV